MEDDIKVYEAFTPSGTEAADNSAGLFIGSPDLIKDWVAQLSPYWKAHQVRLSERTVLSITSFRLTNLRDAQAEKERLRARIEELEKGI